MIGLRKSAWRFETAGSGGVAIEIIALSGGILKLFDPSEKETVFHYGALGVGAVYGFKVPYFGKINFKVKGINVSGAAAPTMFKNAGSLYMTDSFSGTELKKSDLQGATVFLEGNIAYIGGVSVNAMLLGVDAAMLYSALTNTVLRPLLLPIVLARAPAVLIMSGATVLLQAGAGVSLNVGYLA